MKDLFNQDQPHPDDLKPKFVFKMICFDSTEVIAKQNIVKLKIKAESVVDAHKRAMEMVKRMHYEVLEIVEPAK